MRSEGAMSEKREGWLGWMNAEQTKNSHTPGIRRIHPGAQTETRYTDPVWVQPLDPDGPKPGETWKYGGYEVDVLTVPFPSTYGGIRVAVESQHHGIMFPEVSDLSPIKPTRTLAVEATEEEAEAVRAAHAHGIHGALGSLYAKLAAALEAE